MDFNQANDLETALHEALDYASKREARGIGLAFHFILTVVHGYSHSDATQVVMQWCSNWVARKKGQG